MLEGQKAGLTFKRYFTESGKSPYDQFEYERRSSVIRNPEGDIIFEMNDVEVPHSWSQVATDILAQKYFRKTGVPTENGNTGAENSIRQVAHRLADCWKTWGLKDNYVASEKDAQIFYDELVYTIVGQFAAPNSPQWFNTGLSNTYGITGKPQGHYYVEPETEQLKKSTSAYERPQPHACFILSVEDDLVNGGGIMDLWVREARIFKYGSGVGTNFSNIRGANEKLSGGGFSSGLMSFLKIGDRAAGAIKSGGTTRRAAKMVCLDLDHPEVVSFIKWKAREEKKVAGLIAAGYAADYEGEAYQTVSGQNSNNSIRIPNSFFEKLQKEAMDVAKQSQEKHEKLVTVTKNIDDMRKRSAPDKEELGKKRKETKQAEKALKPLEQELKEISAKLGEEAKEKATSRRKKEEEKARATYEVIKEKLKKGGKLTTDDILVMQRFADEEEPEEK